MNGWSQSVHKIHKRFAPNCFLYQIFSPSAKICTFSKSDHIIHTHTHKTSEDLHTVYRPKHTVNLKNSQHIPTQTNWNWAQFQKVRLIPYKTRYAFSCSPPGQGSYVHKLSLPLEWSQVTYIPASTTRSVSFLQYLCQTTVWWRLSSRMALCLSSTLTNIQVDFIKLYTNK